MPLIIRLPDSHKTTIRCATNSIIDPPTRFLDEDRATTLIEMGGLLMAIELEVEDVVDMVGIAGMMIGAGVAAGTAEEDTGMALGTILTVGSS